MRAYRYLVTALLLSTSGVSADVAAQPDFLRAVVDSPALRAAERRTSAARERINAAGRLPDPEIEGMGARMTGPMDERSTIWELNLRQPLPKKGERSADRDRAKAGAAMAEADYAAMAGEMAADLAMALAEAEGADARIKLIEVQIGRLEAVLRSIEVRLSAGTGGRIADRLTVQTRIAAMQLMTEEERQMAADALAEARGRLGLKPDDALPRFAAPASADIKVDEAAALKLAEARVAEATAMGKMARASANPMTAVGVRFERERSAMGNEDTVGLAFMSEIPWRGRGYARSEARAAEAERSAATADATAARYRINAALTRVDRAERLAATSRRLSEETRRRLESEYEAMVRAAGVASMGESTVLQTVELLEKATETELQVIRADTAARSARADLWRYVPATHFTTARK